MNSKIKSFSQQSNTDVYSKPIGAEGASLRRIKKFISVSCDNSFVGMGLFSPEGNFSIVNRELCRMLGRTEKELKIINFYNLIYTDDLNNVPVKTSCNKLGMISNLQCEVRFSVRGGVSGWFQSTITTVYPRGRNVSFFLQLIDVNSKKQAELALMRKEQEYQNIVENSPDVIIRYNMEGCRISVNSQFEEMSGMTSFGEVRNTFDEIEKMGPDFADQYKQKLDQVFREKVLSSFDIEGTDGDGIPHYYQIKLVPEFDHNGQMTGVLGFGREVTAIKQTQIELENISDQKHSERVLCQSSQLLESVMDNIPQAIFWKDRNLTYRGCNRAFAEYAGLASPAEIVGKTDYELPWSLYADLYRTDDQLVLGSGNTKLNYEVQQATPTGGHSWLLTNKIPIRDSGGNVVALLGTYEDITRRKQAEMEQERSAKLLRTIINSIHDLIYVKDVDGRFLVASQALARQMGRQTPEELVGKTDYDLFPYELAHSYYADEQKIIQTGEPMIDKEEPSVRPDGTALWLLTTKMPYFSAEGKIIGTVGVGHDITERKQVEIEREQLLTEVQRSQKLLRSVIDTTPDWIFIKDCDHRYLMVNQGYANALHINTEDIIGKNDLELGFPEELVKGNTEKGIRGFWADDSLVMDSGQMQVYPDDPATIDGVVHVFHTVKSPLRNASGQVWGVLAFARDITEVKKSNERLEMLTNAIERVDIPVFINNDEGALVYVNPKACQALGYSSSELHAMNITDVDHHFDRGMLKTMYAGLLPGQLKFIKLKSKQVDKSGHVFPVEVSLTIYNWQGKNFGVSLVRDLSNQHQTDEMLIQTEQDFMVLVDHSPDIIVRYNHLMKCTYVNMAWESITGYLQYNMFDKTPVQNSYLPIEVTQEMERILQQVIQTRKGVQQRFVLPHASTGEAVYLLVDVVPEQSLNGDLAGIMVVARNVTEMEKAGALLERRQIILEEAQQLGHIGSWELDLVTNKREWSKETYRIFEMNPDQIIPTNDAFMALVHPDDKESVNEIYCELGKTRTSYEVELRLLFPDGRVKYVNERGTTQFDNIGKPKRYLGSVQDITQWKELQNELMLALEKAEASSRMKSSFLALMSHEIRTPLNAIMGFSSLLKDTELNIEERDEFIRLVDLGGTRLTSAIDRILELSKLVSGDITVNAEPYSPAEIIMQQYQELEELFRDTGKEMLSIKVEIANNLDGENFVSDAERIKQAIKMLADNALKFTASGEIVLGVKLAGSGQVAFYVSDTGIGIPPEKQDVIFDPFVQVEGSLSRKFEGLGIGLSAARKITSALGGDLTLVSEPGKGSVFSFTIPNEYIKQGR